jgi:hypothetical protein
MSRTAGARGTTNGLLAAYVRAWAAQQALVLAFGGFASRWDQLQAALVFAAALSGHVVPTAFAFGVGELLLVRADG